MLVSEIRALESPDRPMAEVHDFSMWDERERERREGEAEAGESDFRAVAPPVLSFAAARRRWR